MTTPEGEKVPEGEPVPPPRPPVSNPVNFLAALLLSALLVYNLWLDSHAKGYDGKWPTFLLCFGVLFCLGVPINRLLSMVSKVFKALGGDDDV